MFYLTILHQLQGGNVPPRTILVGSLSALMKVVEEDDFFNVGEGIKPQVWFRGHEDESWSLVPSLYRKVKSSTDFQKVEKALLLEFRTRAYHLLGVNRDIDDYSLMSMMQHYQSPTRLLDWSESLWASLFFAEEQFIFKPDSFKGYTPCIWAIKPNKFLNDKIKHFSLIAMHKEVKEETTDYIIITSPFLSERIKVQHGSFICFPNEFKEGDNRGLPQYALELQTNSENFLLKIVLSSPIEIARELIQLGMRKSMFYPELVAFSDDINLTLSQEWI